MCGWLQIDPCRGTAARGHIWLLHVAQPLPHPSEEYSGPKPGRPRTWGSHWASAAAFENSPRSAESGVLADGDSCSESCSRELSLRSPWPRKEPQTRSSPWTRAPHHRPVRAPRCELLRSGSLANKSIRTMQRLKFARVGRHSGPGHTIGFGGNPSGDLPEGYEQADRGPTRSFRTSDLLRFVVAARVVELKMMIYCDRSTGRSFAHGFGPVGRPFPESGRSPGPRRRERWM